jgi:hypothetical protein
MKRTMFNVWEVLLDKACEIASEFEIEASRHRVVVRQRSIVYYPVDNTSDYWRLSLYVNCLLGLFRGRTIISSSKQQGAVFLGGSLSKQCKSSRHNT